MTFRELLDKYRAGQASEEERAMVEAELEKSEAIADYLAEQVEDALGAAETQAPAGEVRHIQKKVNRRLRRTAVWADFVFPTGGKSDRQLGMCFDGLP